MPDVEPHLVGAAWPSATPAADPVLYGHVELQPGGTFEVRSAQTFRLVYTVGRYGIDDTGSIRVVFRFPGSSSGFICRYFTPSVHSTNLEAIPRKPVRARRGGHVVRLFHDDFLVLLR